MLAESRGTTPRQREVRRAISRSLATILFLTLFQVIAAPNFLVPAAEAYTQGTASQGPSFGGGGGSDYTGTSDCSNGAITGIGTSSTLNSNLYVTAFSFTCRAINNDATMGSTTNTYTPLNTPDVSHSCASTQAAVGLTIVTANPNGGSYIAGLGLICGNPMSQGSRDTKAVMPGSATVVSPVTSTFNCSAGNLLTGFKLRTGGGIDQLIPKCSPFTGFTFGAVGAPSVTVSNRSATISYAAVTGSTADTALTYTISYSSATGFSSSATTTSTSITVTDLPANVSLTFTVTASNAYGSSAATGSASGTVTLPGSDTDTAGNFTSGTTSVYRTDGSAVTATNAITVEAWVMPTETSTNSWNMVLSRDKVFQLGFQVSGGKSYWYYGLSGTTTLLLGVKTNIPVTFNEWHHIAFTRDTNTNAVNFYLDGVAAYYGTADGAGTGALSTTSSPFAIGSRRDSVPTVDSFFKGYIDQVMIFNTVRSTADIVTDMNSYLATNTSGLVAYYDFNEGTGSLLYNRQSSATNAGDLTISGMTWSDVKSVDTTTLSSYTIIKFPRSYLTSIGGWRAPVTKKVGYLFAAGGGAGGRSDSTAYEAGGGGAGGILNSNTDMTANSIYPIIVGTGGVGVGSANPTSGRNTSALSITVTGGGYGGFATLAGGSGGSGGGGTHQMTAGGTGIAGQGTAGEQPIYSSSGGGGGGATYTGLFGAGGYGLYSNITGVNISYGDGGSASYFNGTNGSTLPGGNGNGGRGADVPVANGTLASGANGVANTGSGGGGGYGSSSAGRGGNGGSGVVILRYLNVAKPIFTSPVNDTLTAGMTETFTVSGSTTSGTTRSFLWQSSSDTGTTWVNISTGTGFRTSSYVTPTLETTTSGIRYQYRVVVTETDTSGLLISDTSTGVYLIINPRISISGTYTVQKYGVTHTDTFTALSSTGTGNKTFSYTTNTSTGLTWNASTVNQITLTVAATLKPGTYNETITATDTLNAKTSLALAIVVSKADTVTVTVISVTDTYTGSTLTFTPRFTITGLLNSDTITASSVVWNYSGTENSGTTYASSTTRPLNAGSYTITPTVPSLSDSYTATTIVTAPLTIVRASRTITETISATTVKYGSTLTLTSSVTPGSGLGTTTYSTTNSDSCTVSGSTITAIKSSGTCSFTAMISQSANFETATSTAKTATLSKADTITVTAATPKIFTYTGSQVALVETATVVGLKLTDTATPTSVTFTYGAAASTCAAGGTCALGDIGPGGGIVFYDAGSQQSWGRYLEMAKSGWSGVAGEKTALWCSSALANTVSNIRAITLGSGYSNSVSLATFCGAGAAYLSRNYNGGGKSDWFLPTTGEFQLAYNNRSYLDLDASLSYWLSHEANDSNASWVGNAWVMGSAGTGGSSKSSTLSFRPIRAFAAGDSSVTYSGTLPTNAGNYLIKASNLTLTSGSLTDYVAVSYVDAWLTIKKALQSQLIIAQYGATFGTPYKLIIIGGSGTGAITQTVSVGTASSCTLNGDTVTAGSVGTCLVTVTKASDTNYESVTASIAIYFLNFLLDQPTGQVGSGATIALNGNTSLTVENPATVKAPSISGLSTYSAAVGQQITITGAYFDIAGGTSVEFWRGVPAITFTVDSTTQIRATVPTDANSGKVLVITPNGIGVSELAITITP